MLMPGTTVVVSPLIALMQDQFEKMSDLGIASVQVNSAIPRDEVRRARKKIGRRTVEFVFTTPEQLASDQFRTLLASAHVDLLVIDEAHCITQWGHDFRPAYLEALGAMRALGKPTVLALTATAPPEVIDDIAQQLNLGPLHVVNTGAHRPNLSYSCASRHQRHRQATAAGGARSWIGWCRDHLRGDGEARRADSRAPASGGRPGGLVSRPDARERSRRRAGRLHEWRRADSSSPPTPLAWGSTDRTSGPSSITTCQPPWMCTPRSPAARGATVCRRSASCCFSARIGGFRRSSWRAGIRPPRTSPA